VAIIVTGSELRAPGERLEPGQIYDANGFILAAQLRSTGAVVERLPPVADDEAATRDAIERGLAADVLVTTGGVSVGVHDLVRTTEAELGVEEIFWRVAMQPASPLRSAFAAGRSSSACRATPYRRSSASSSSSVLRCLPCRGSPIRSPRFVRAVSAVRRNASRHAMRCCGRARASTGMPYCSTRLTGQQSHMIAQAATADALVLVPQGEGELAAGSPVSYLQL